MKPFPVIILLALAFLAGAAFRPPTPHPECSAHAAPLGRTQVFTAEPPLFIQQPGAFTPAPMVQFVSSSAPAPRALPGQPDMELPDAGEVFNASLLALLEKRWSLALVGLLLLGILGLRKAGGAFFPFLKTDLGGAVLAVGAGAFYTAYKALTQAEDPTIGLVLVAAASGAWSWASKCKLLDLLTAALTPPSKRKARAVAR